MVDGSGGVDQHTTPPHHLLDLIKITPKTLLSVGNRLIIYPRILSIREFCFYPLKIPVKVQIRVPPSTSPHSFFYFIYIKLRFQVNYLIKNQKENQLRFDLKRKLDGEIFVASDGNADGVSSIPSA